MATTTADPLAKRPVEPPDEGEVPLARFLLDQLWEAGVQKVFGIPGDFIIRLCRVIEEDPRIDLMTLSHEPGVGFAASGAARETGLGVACVTYGAGALNMVNPVAAAWAEKTPLLVLTGGPGQDERSRGILVHHQVKSFDSQLRIFREVTRYQAVLSDPERAAYEIRCAIDTCMTCRANEHAGWSIACSAAVTAGSEPSGPTVSTPPSVVSNVRFAQRSWLSVRDASSSGTYAWP